MKIYKYEIFDFAGNDVTSQFLSTTPNPPKRYLVFANGYRGAVDNWDVTYGTVTTNDRHSYWGSIDNQFISRLKPKTTFYIDGSDRIITSNHLNFGKFLTSMSEIYEEWCEVTPTCQTLSTIYNVGTNYIDELFEPSDPYKLLNDVANISGFQERVEKEKLAAKTFLAAISSGSTPAKDTIDIVCHSMGYAYAVGFINELQSKVKFGRIYIIAPENACSGAADWSQFEEVWQYGSNNNPGDPDRDPFYEQDGVAPQCAVPNITELSNEIPHGRAYIPDNGVERDFTESHSISNYGWIFSKEKGENGYVKQR